MSLYKDLETTGYVFLPQDANDKITYKTFIVANADYTIKINVIRMTAEEQLLYGEEMAEYHANVNDTNASNITSGSKIMVNSIKYEVTNQPKVNKLFSQISLRLKPIND